MNIVRFAAARAGLKLGVAAFSLMVAAAASAQSAPIQLDTPAQPLAATLKQIGRQAKVEILFSASDVRNAQVAPLRGNFDVDQALASALAGTPLHARRTAQGAYVIAADKPAAGRHDAASAAAVSGGAISRTTESATGEGESATARAAAGDIVVTANRREENVLKVAGSIAAYSQESLDQKGIRSVEDLARNTPGVNLSQGFSGIKYIAIRGLQSSVGATMTGIYIDDTPIHIRSLVLMTFFSPALYDLERVEVLRGPQGTLFGSSAMGGAIRYILAKPDLQKFTGNFRSELAFTQNGAPTWEVGGAIGGPIVQDKIGFRVSAYDRRDGGYIDRVPWRPDRGTPEKNSNSNRNFGATAALTFKPTEDLTITPSAFYQVSHRDDASTYWTFGNGSTRPQPPVFQSGEGTASWGRDRDNLYQLKAQWDVGPVSLISNTAKIDRHITSRDDSTAFYLDIYRGVLGTALDGILPLVGGTGPLNFELGLPGGPGQPNCGECIFINLDMHQKGFTQEFRVQSRDPAARFKYVLGAFYQNTKQTSLDHDSAPYGTGDYLFILPRGSDGLVANSFSGIRDKQYAVFGQIDWEVVDRLTLTAGVRYSQLDFRSQSIGTDVVTNMSAPGPVQTNRERPLTPKFGVQFEPRPGLMFYATASKGFRSGGVNTATTDPACANGLALIGYTAIPDTYKSDSVWSYEAGAKGRIGRVATFAADIFDIEWNGIQQSRQLLGCTATFTDNFGKARSRGFEAQITITPAKGLTLDANVGYVDATQRQTINTTPGDPTSTTITRKGDRFATPWTINLTGNYETALGWNDAKGYGMLQWTHRSGWSAKPGNVGFNPVLGTTDQQNNVSVRLGVRRGGLDVSAFVNNLTNSRDIIGRLNFQPSERIQVQTWRPRTIGFTGRYHF